MIRHAGCLWRYVVVVLLLVLTAGPPTLSVASDPHVQLLQEFGIDKQQQRAISAGDIVSADGKPALQKELTGSVAMRLAVPPDELARQIRSGLNVLADPKVFGFAAIGPAGGDDVWRNIAYAPSELAEAKRFAQAEPGTAFNLSPGELAAVQRRFAGRRLSTNETLQAAAAAWREVLAGRVRAYRERGLDGLAGYDRGESTSLPGEELHDGDLAPYVPEALASFVRAVDRFPVLPPRIESYFFWKKTEIDDRPAFVLSHVMIEESGDAVRFALREFYVSHTYNVLQQFGMAMPTSDGGSTLVVINSTITDRLPSVFASLARTIGERRARSALEDYFISIRRMLAAEAPLSGG